MSKRDIRDQIRQLPDGENEWQRVQGIVYGRRMGEATLIEGVEDFFKDCKRHQAQVLIVSHKTERAHFDATRTNLRSAALSWMEQESFFEENGLGLSPEDVFFEGTRLEKIDRIRRLQCTHFIDDLEEVFLETAFPDHVEKTLYAPHWQGASPSGLRVARSWNEISKALFNARN